MRLTYYCLALSALSIACLTSVPKASRELDLAAKDFKSPPGKARIYVYQSGYRSVLGTISVDGDLVGVMRGNMFVVADVTPGRHVVVAKSETDTALSGGALGSSMLTLEAVTNAVYFVRLTYGFGWPFHAPPLKVVSDTEGRKAVLKTKLAFPFADH
jgi:hypothetical protein